ncbi:MAG: DUF1624 domain-containing protein [Patescibacteria group bacterium]|nr:DUF1624 domain-containing protein [Patescibacteria group bacterium]MDE2015212.1 DUF1624 domain-containing protein [Patescibacteria group bacterium]MDE2226639.1 DUF1624 domain-containing protein [Patescibacteria group bacterium]
MEKRWQALDEMRGLTMILLTIFFPLSFFDNVPPWLKHSSGNGIYLEDIGAPVFFFIIGASYFISFTKKKQVMSVAKLIFSFLRRYLLFIALGFIGGMLLDGKVGIKFHWNVLTAIGLCGILVLPFMYAGYKVRIAAAIAITSLWQIFISTGHQDWALTYAFGGPWATPAWSSIILFGSAISEIKEKIKSGPLLPILVGTAIVIFFIGVGAEGYFPDNKHLVSFPYVMISVAISIFALAVFEAKGINGFLRFPLFSIVGKNPLAIYVISGIESSLIEKILPATLSIGLIAVVTAMASLLCIAASWVMDKKKMYLKI